jgi:cellulose synthase (UDP-forming)
MALEKKNKDGINLNKEYVITWFALALTLLAAFMLIWQIGGDFLSHPLISTFYILCCLFVLYSNIVYFLCRYGFLKRLQTFRPANDSDLHLLYHQNAPTITFLLPSYKEDTRIIRQSLFSSALQDYPFRRVVLLIDDPPLSSKQDDLKALAESRELVVNLQLTLKGVSKQFKKAYEDFLVRENSQQIDLKTDLKRLSLLYCQAIDWFQLQADRYPLEDHTDTTFVRLTFLERASHLRKRESHLVSCCNNLEKIRIEYFRLATLFDVEISSFERKKYINLSHASNKAMNLNSYIGLMGKNLTEVETPSGIKLIETNPLEAKIQIPDSDYVAMLDADSVLTFDYAIRLTHVMENPNNQKLAIIQTPYSAYPNSHEALERTAGATTDLGYNIHQGLTYFDATFWVGANAIARKTALKEIAEEREERGYPIVRYIQDRTVIEDSESTIDLVFRGWKLYNYPQRLSYSATPSDFGALLIQRRRWANGGLLILPKLLIYIFQKPRSWSKFLEGFFRFYCLFSHTGMLLVLFVLCLFPLHGGKLSTWFLLSTFCSLLVCAKDLKLAGYKYTDLLRIIALNLLLIPVNTAGVLKSLQQALTGKNFPFCRTPKIQGRTTVPSLYVALEYFILGYSLWGPMNSPSSHAFFTLPLLYAIIVFMGLSESVWDLIPFFKRCYQTIIRKFAKNALSSSG